MGGNATRAIAPGQGTENKQVLLFEHIEHKVCD